MTGGLKTWLISGRMALVKQEVKGNSGLWKEEIHAYLLALTEVINKAVLANIGGRESHLIYGGGPEQLLER